MASALVDLLQPALPYFVAIQNPSFDFGGVPRVAAAVMRVRSLVGSLSLAADLLLSYLVVCAGGHARNLLLSEPFVGVVSAQSLFPVFLVVWLLAVGTNLLAFLPLKLVAVVLNALSRVRSVSLAVSAAALVLGDQNKIGIAIVGIAQASGQNILIIVLRQLLHAPAVAADSATFGFGVVSSIAAGVSLTLVQNSPLQPIVFAGLTIWFSLYAIYQTFAVGGTPVAATSASASSQQASKKKKE